MLGLIRHGETVANEAGLYAGLAEYELTLNGRSQAARVGAFIATELSKDLLIDGPIISSPISRAYQTAEIITGHLPGVDIVLDERIREVDYGRLDGEPIRKGLSFINEAYRHNGGEFEVEPAASIRQRASNFIADNAEYLDPMSRKIKLAVGHGALWGVASALVQAHPLLNAKIPKNYEIILLARDSASVIDTREMSDTL